MSSYDLFQVLHTKDVQALLGQQGYQRCHIKGPKARPVGVIRKSSFHLHAISRPRPRLTVVQEIFARVGCRYSCVGNFQAITLRRLESFIVGNLHTWSGGATTVSHFVHCVPREGAVVAAGELGPVQFTVLAEPHA